MFLSLLVTAGLSLILYLTGLFIFFAPLPFTYAYLRRGPGVAIAGALLSLLTLTFLYRLPLEASTLLPAMILYPAFSLPQITGLGLLYFFYYAWMGLLTGFLAKKTDSLEKSFALLLLVSPVAPLAILLGLAMETHISLLAETRLGLQFLLGRMIQLQESSGLAGEEIAFLKQNGSEIVAQVMRLIPALLIISTAMILSMNILFMRRWTSVAPSFTGWVPFMQWRLEEKWIWFPILIGSGYFANLYLLHSPLLGTVLMNLLLILIALYFYQGLGISSFFLRRRLTPFVRLAAYALFFLFIQIIGIFMVFLGLFDFWFDFRKLKKIGSQPAE